MSGHGPSICCRWCRDGTAERVPEAIRALAASGPDHVEAAYWRLDNVVVLQGTVYEAAFFAIPYVLAIITSHRHPAVRAAAYDLLVEIARGTSAGPRATVIGDDGREHPLLEASIERIASAGDRYETDLRQGDRLVRHKRSTPSPRHASPRTQPPAHVAART